ncbi:FKBP-type peptidyl-prolyl cis-trans isomerase [Fulvivirga sediminis]|uniref:Peptidyl-prolyl cis-trans isomerase n=1 Tax=Fulvivirga sediminis TaxID=2803949 RepID=A0A937K262_9BACT|nr:FKBP-type peptidyl-prolyl cis-trans isomerase [Fulvivirga sediminis]MBL3658030.1 FKBP-type peptidyl-prolyl cis-trans isomerase [Fulvivirga sediminis]
MKLKPIILSVSLILTFFLTGCNDDDESFNAADQYKQEQEEITNYLKQNGLSAQTDTSSAELKYIINEKGNGDRISNDDVTLVDITGTLLNGNKFYEKDSIYIRANTWIAGYYILAPYFTVGSKGSMFIPSYYGYGTNAAFDGDLPANTPMRLDVTFRGTQPSFDYEQMVIRKYLDDKDLTAEVDEETGLMYIIEKEGNDNFPTSSSSVNVTYKGTFLNGETFDSGTSSFNLSNLIKGWQILMPYVSEGGSITMFLPSKYAYGSSGAGSIAPYSTLIFKIDLKKIN